MPAWWTSTNKVSTENKLNIYQGALKLVVSRLHDGVLSRFTIRFRALAHIKATL